MTFEQYLSGMVALRLPAQRTEWLLQQLLASGIAVYRVKRQPDYVEFWIYLDDYAAVQHLLREQRCRFHVQQRWGLPFVISRFQRRKGLWMGLALGVAMVYLLLSCIWGYAVSGNQQYSDRHMIALVQEYGMIPGARSDKFDYDGLAHQIVQEHPEFTWLNLQMVGTTLQIQVKERLPGTVELGTTGSLVAKADGKVTELLVFRGTALVNRGDWVKQGQVLVGGWDYSDRQRDQNGQFVPVGEPYAVRAQAVISGQQERRVVGSCALEEQVLVPTGQTSKQIALAWQGHQMVLWGAKYPPYQYCSQQAEQHRLLSWKGYGLPLYIRTTVFTEKALRQVSHTRAEAYAEAVERARKKLQAQMPAGSRFLRESIGLCQPERQHVVQAEVVWLVEEPLAQMQQVSLPPSSPGVEQQETA